jgi:hypothetical protein
MWFLHDAAPVHFNLATREWLGILYPPPWIGSGCEASTPWPPRLPDLSPIRFYLRGSWKMRFTLALLSQASNFGNTHRMEQTIFVPHPGFQMRPNPVPTSCRQGFSSPWRTFRISVVQCAASKPFFSQAHRISEVLEHYNL